MTRERCYILAGYLADIREENFAVPDEVQESIVDDAVCLAYGDTLEAMDDVIICQ